MATPIFLFCKSLRVQQEDIKFDSPNAYSNWPWARQEVSKVLSCRSNIDRLNMTTLFDAVAIPTLLVIGILGALSLITLPTAASYAMIGTAAAGVLGWIAILYHTSMQKSVSERV